MDVHSLLKRYDIRPSKGLGQNFLIADWAFDRIIEASELSSQDHVLEIGPGLGTLTRRLADAAGHVTAVELDARMVAILRETLAGRANVTVCEGDILALSPASLLAGEGSCLETGCYKVVANLPYYITSRVLRHLLEASLRPTLLTLMVQQEVAERIVAQPGQMSTLAVSVQTFGEAQLVATVAPTDFYPVPQVSSAILTIRTYPSPAVPEPLLDRFFEVVRAGFQQRRKQLHNSLVSNLNVSRDRLAAALAEAGIAPQARPQTLGVGDWLQLVRALYPDQSAQ